MTDKNNGCGCGIEFNRIRCEVENCRYHEIDNCCSADMIEVTPSFATSEDDTSCSTFEAKL